MTHIAGGSHPLDQQEIDQLKLALTEAEATRLNLEWRLGEAQAALTEATQRAERAEVVLDAVRVWRATGVGGPAIIAALNAYEVGTAPARNESEVDRIIREDAEAFMRNAEMTAPARTVDPAPSEPTVDEACPRCGGLDGTHTRRGCPDAYARLDPAHEAVPGRTAVLPADHPMCSTPGCMFPAHSPEQVCRTRVMWQPDGPMPRLDPAHEAVMAAKLDAGLADINRRAAADKRVLDAAEFAVARLREQFGRPDSDWFEDYTR